MGLRLFSQAQIARQTQHFRKVRYITRSGADFVSSAAISQGQLQISQEAQHFGKVRCGFRGRRNTFRERERERQIEREREREKNRKDKEKKKEKRKKSEKEENDKKK